MMRRSFAVWLPLFVLAGVNSQGWNLGPHGGYHHPQRYPQPPRYPQTQRYPQPQGQQQDYEITKGTLDQLNQIDAHWICTNQRTGDMIVIGTDNADTNNRFPGQNTGRPGQPTYPQYPQNPQRPQQPIPQNPQYPQNPQQPIPQNPQYPQQPQQPIPQNPQYPQNPQQPIPQNPQYPQNPQQPIPQNPQVQQPQQPQKPQQPGFPEIPWTLLPGNSETTAAPVQTTTADPFHKFDNFDWASYVSTPASTNTPGRRVEDAAVNGQGIIDPRFGP